MRIKTRYLLDRDFNVLTDVVFEVDSGHFGTVSIMSEYDIDLGDAFVAPGLVNAHSHAFQRSIRGRTEWLSAERPDDDFWSWREQMYASALTLDSDAVYRISRQAFDEMARSGVTAVGEFHYLHHRPDGTPYDDRNELSHRVIEAAKDAGIRIALLLVLYGRAGYQRAPDPRQRRFIETDLDLFFERVASLERDYESDPHVSIGVAPHSIRAVGRDGLERARDWGQNGGSVHIHACEQPREIEESLAEYGRPPLEVFDEIGLFGTNLTLVHATHLTDGELEVLEQRPATVCACPTTERNLGDGFLPARELVSRDVPIALGSDSHTAIDLFDEMRLVEYHERLRYQQRNVLARQAYERDSSIAVDGRIDSSRILWPTATVNGARSLGLETGRIEKGAPADFIVIDASHVSLRGSDASSISNDVVFTMPPDAVTQTWVLGQRVF